MATKFLSGVSPTSIMETTVMTTQTTKLDAKPFTSDCTPPMMLPSSNSRLSSDSRRNPADGNTSNAVSDVDVTGSSNRSGRSRCMSLPDITQLNAILDLQEALQEVGFEPTQGANLNCPLDNSNHTSAKSETRMTGVPVLIRSDPDPLKKGEDEEDGFYIEDSETCGKSNSNTSIQTVSTTKIFGSGMRRTPSMAAIQEHKQCTLQPKEIRLSTSNGRKDMNERSFEFTPAPELPSGVPRFEDNREKRSQCSSLDVTCVGGVPISESNGASLSPSRMKKSRSMLNFSRKLSMLKTSGNNSVDGSEATATKSSSKTGTMRKSVSMLDFGSSSRPKDTSITSVAYAYPDGILPPAPARSSLKRSSYKSSNTSNQKAKDNVVEANTVEPSMKRNISFTNIEIREYGLTLGDHPNCSVGPPVQLSWNVESETTHTLENYELFREPRRSKKEMVLSNYVRMKMLSAGRVPKAQVYEAIAQVKKIQSQRKRTKALLEISIAQPVEEVLQTLFRRRK